jgi:fluoroquinolone transport system permease protein
METFQNIKSLGPVDLKSIGRDPLLRWMLVLPLVIALAMRFVAPPILMNLEAIVHLEVMPYYPVMIAYMLLILVPSLVGMVTGFLLLDQRDDRTLTALQVTPLSISGYLAYRIGIPSVVSVIVTAVMFPAAGIFDIGVLPLLLSAALASFMAPLTALFLATFAANKVQGFALMKAFGVILIPPMIAYFIQSPWQLLLGFFPTYWPARLYWSFQANLPGSFFYFTAGLAYQSFLLILLLRRFQTILTRQ